MRRDSFINRCAWRRNRRRALHARSVMSSKHVPRRRYSQYRDRRYIPYMAKAKPRKKAARKLVTTNKQTARKHRQLPEYEAKRDFAITPEPAPGAVEPSAVPTYMIHKHHATRLHYDL